MRQTKSGDFLLELEKGKDVAGAAERLQATLIEKLVGGEVHVSRLCPIKILEVVGWMRARSGPRSWRP
jgi:hypothetical protein